MTGYTIWAATGSVWFLYYLTKSDRVRLGAALTLAHLFRLGWGLPFVIHVGHAAGFGLMASAAVAVVTWLPLRSVAEREVARLSEGSGPNPVDRV